MLARPLSGQPINIIKERVDEALQVSRLKGHVFERS
jgi:hypothetical protein